MTDEQILLKIGNYIISKLEQQKDSPNFSYDDYKEKLENTKNLALKYWDIIYKLQKDSSVSLIRIEQEYNGEIYVFCENHYIGEFENFCECDAFLPIISIIAENSNINGKFNNWHHYPSRGIDFSFK